MNRQFDQPNYVSLTPAQIEKYVYHARQVRNEVVMRGLKRSFSFLQESFKWVIARLGDVFHSTGGKESGAHRAC